MTQNWCLFTIVYSICDVRLWK